MLVYGMNISLRTFQKHGKGKPYLRENTADWAIRERKAIRFCNSVCIYLRLNLVWEA